MFKNASTKADYQAIIDRIDEIFAEEKGFGHKISKQVEMLLTTAKRTAQELM